MLESLRLLIVDDQPRARQSLRALLGTKFRITGFDEAANGEEALLCVKQYRPDVVLMDARMPVLDGIEATRLIKANTPQVQVIVLSMYPEYRAPALAAGADAFVTKGKPPEELLKLLADMTGANQKEV
jgi:DNA-binding NarL/FixJ family response regulator